MGVVDFSSYHAARRVHAHVKERKILRWFHRMPLHLAKGERRLQNAIGMRRDADIDGPAIIRPEVEAALSEKWRLHLQGSPRKARIVFAPGGDSMARHDLGRNGLP